MNLLLKDVRVTAAASTRALLDRITCLFAHGETTLLIGRTGAGKSTLLDLLAGLRTPNAGQILLENDGAFRVASARDLRNLTTLSFQSPEEQLFASEVRGELSYTLRPFRLTAAERHRRMTSALARAGLSPAWLARNPLLQSTGQKRRIALACAFAPLTPWLLLDEPTAGLDPAARAAFVRHFEAWRDGAGDGAGCGAIIATHDLSAMLPVADRVIILKQGRIAADCSPDQLRADPAPLQAAGVGLPPEFAARRLLCALGVQLSMQDDPATWADAIFRRTASQPAGQPPALDAARGASSADDTPAASDGDMQPGAGMIATSDGDMQPGSFTLSDGVAPRASYAVRRTVRTLDIRARWLAYLLLTAGALLQQTWIGALAAALASFALMSYIRVPWRPLWLTARAYLPFILLAALIAGLQFGPAPAGRLPVHFTQAPALRTARQLSIILLALLWARVLTIVAPPGELRRGLSEVAATLPAGRRQAMIVAFGAGLVLRLMTQILREWRRFSRIVRARGKSSAKEGKIALRDAPALIIPLILAMLQHTEDMALAIEARGCRTIGADPVARQAARPLRRRDLAAVAVAAACFLLLLVIRNI